MISNNYPTWFKISADIEPLSIQKIKELNPYKPHCDRYSLYKFSVTDIMPEFSRVLEIAKLGVNHMQIFYRPGDSRDMDAFIHTDGHMIIPDLAKINFVYSLPGNLMKWWLPKIDVTEKNKHKTEIGSNYLKFSESECQMIDQKDLIGLYVVNAGIPHSVHMTQASVTAPRICVSITPTIKNCTRVITGCQEIVDRLEHAINILNEV